MVLVFTPMLFFSRKTRQINLKLIILVTELRVFPEQNYYNLPQQKPKNMSNTVLDLLEIISDNSDRKF
jgi:hypothetical protein